MTEIGCTACQLPKHALHFIKNKRKAISTMKRPDYGYETMKLDIQKIMRALVQDKAHRQYKLWLADHASHDPASITGPHAADRNAMHFPFIVGPMSCNRHGTLHGGVAAKLLDTFTSMHYVAASGDFRNVTVNLNLTYLRAMPKGTKGVVVTYVQKAGRNLIMLEGKIVDAADPSITYVSCTHTKAALPPLNKKAML